MRLLFDESAPYRPRRALPIHTIRTVVEMGWGGTKNGQLLSLASASFDALITVDKNIDHQQNISTLPVAVLLVSAKSNELAVLLPMVPELERALSSLQPKS